MSLPSLEQAVLKKADEEAAAILEKAREEAEARLARESARLKAEHERRVAAARAEMEGALERETGAREAEDRMKLLKIKNEIIREVFDRAVEGARSLPDDGYAAWLKSRLDHLPKLEAAQVLVNEQDRDLMARILQETSAEGSLKLAETNATIRAGFLVQGKEADLDFSVEALMDVLRESLGQEIAQRLFGDEPQEKAE